MKQFYIFIFTFLFSFSAKAQSQSEYTYIPDLNFETELGTFIDVGPIDNYILTANLAAMQDDITIVEARGITDITGIAAMTGIYGLIIKNNPIATIDFSGNPYLEYIILENLNLTQVNLASNIYVKNLKITGMSVSDIDLSAQTILETLEIDGSLITNFDLSSKTQLYKVILTNNQLTSLNVKNNNNFNLYEFDATGNPNLDCIQVDNQTNAIAATGAYSSWAKDATASYAENCNTLSSNAFKTNVVTIYPNPIKNNQTLEFKNITSQFTFSLYDVSGKLIERKLITDNQYNVSGLVKGIYSFTIESNNHIATNKLVILD